MDKILVICIGNICRSPMAEGLLRQALPGKAVLSAGLGALVGHAADPFSVQIMQEQGIDISAHRAQSISARMVSEADLILTMDLEQKRFIETQYTGSNGKVMRLGEFSKVDITDPYRQSLEQFRAVGDLIRTEVDGMVSRLARMG